jgi:hypothetical protein
MVTLRNSISILTSLKATLKIILVIRTENGSDDLKKISMASVDNISEAKRHKVRVGEL